MPDSVPPTGETILLMENLQGTPVHSSHITDWTKRDPILSQVLRLTLQGWPTANSNEEVNPYFSRRTELSVKDGCVICEQLYPRKEDQRYSQNYTRLSLGKPA